MQDMPDFNNRNYTELNLKEFKKKHYKSKGINGGALLLVFSVSAFLLSMSFWVQKTKLETSSRAFTDNSMQMNVHDTMVPEKLPKAYKGEVIPQTVYDELKSSATAAQVPLTDTYAKQMVTKYYVYRDVLTENNMELPTSETIAQNVLDMEKMIKSDLVSSADFAYVQARFKFSPHEADLAAQYGNLQDKAKALLDTYTALFNDPSYSPEQVVDASNLDEQLTALNDGDKSAYMTDYGGSQSVLISDPSFQDYLFTLTPKEVSPVYTLKTTDDIEYGYVIVYPTRIQVQKYNTLDQILKEKIGNFTF